MGEDGAYFGQSAKGWFFGFQVHALIFMPSSISPLAQCLLQCFFRAIGMTAGPFELLLFPLEEAFSPAIRATAERRLSTGSMTKHRLSARVPSDEDKEGLSAVSQVLSAGYWGKWEEGEGFVPLPSLGSALRRFQCTSGGLPLPSEQIPSGAAVHGK
jgi:hypothetical protein